MADINKQHAKDGCICCTKPIDRGAPEECECRLPIHRENHG